MSLNDTTLPAHLFRHEYGKLVALLVRKLGAQYIDLIEDGVQWAMAQAVEVWPKKDIPNNPPAWLYQVAYRHIITELNTHKRQQTILSINFMDPPQQDTVAPDIPLAGELGDSLLHMLFVTSNGAIPIDSQLVFTLKSLCGFSIKEISLRLFISTDNVYKRFNRAKKSLKNYTLEISDLSNLEMNARLPSVHQILYLIFTEGYLSSHSDMAIRKDLCKEAIYLTELLVESNIGNQPESNALLALMYFHYARLHARQDISGSLLLLEQQDRSLWNTKHIANAFILLDRSTQSKGISRYHIEAGIAAQHCLSPSFSQTNWQYIIESYELLEKVSPSPLHILNRALATAELHGPNMGLLVLDSADISPFLARSYHWYAVLSDLQKRSGKFTLATKNASLAIQAAPTDKIKEVLKQRLYPIK